MPDNLRECQQIIQQALDSSLVASHAIGDNSPVLLVERHLSVKSVVVFPAINKPIMLVHLGGGKVTALDPELFSLPSFGAVTVSKKVVNWHLGGTLDLAVIYFNNRAQTQLLRALPKDEGPLLFRDAVVSALTRELLSQDIFINKNHSKTLGKTLLLHLIEIAKRSSKNSGHLYFGQNNIFSIHKVINYIHDHLSENLSSEHLAKQASLSTGHFRRLFQQFTKRPVHKYIRNMRLERTRELLMTTDQPLADIATEIGYSDQAHMTKSFKEAYGVSPAKFRKSSRNF